MAKHLTLARRRPELEEVAACSLRIIPTLLLAGADSCAFLRSVRQESAAQRGDGEAGWLAAVSDAPGPLSCAANLGAGANNGRDRFSGERRSNHQSTQL
jgi:hypothetical protein